MKTVAAPGTGTPPKDQRLLTIATPKQVQHIHIHANKSKYYETVHQYIKTSNKTELELFDVLQRSHGHKEHLKRSSNVKTRAKTRSRG